MHRNPKLALSAHVLHAVLAAALLGLTASAAAQPLPPGPRMIEVEGRDVRVMTAGFEHIERGQLVVVLESGGGTPLQNWDPVFTDVAAFAPVVAYDRAGIGGSEWDGEPPTPERRVAQLRALLAALDAPPPYVLVGHSWGGALIRTYAGRYPDEVAGLVYVDPTDFSQSPAELLALIEGLAPGKGEEAPNPHDSLGDGYRAAGRLEEARASYARAVELGEPKGHPSLPTYRANLEQVAEQLGER